MFRFWSLIITMFVSSCVSTLSFKEVEPEDRNVSLSKPTGHKAIEWYTGEAKNAFQKAKNEGRFVMLVLEDTLEYKSYFYKSIFFADPEFVKLTQLALPILVKKRSLDGQFVTNLLDQNDDFGIFLVSPDKKHRIKIEHTIPMKSLRFALKDLIESYDYKKEEFLSIKTSNSSNELAKTTEIIDVRRELKFDQSVQAIEKKIKYFDKQSQWESRVSLAISLMGDLELWGNNPEYRNNKRLIQLYKRWPDFVSVILESTKTVEYAAVFLVSQRHRILSGFLSWARMIEYKERLNEAMVFLSENEVIPPSLRYGAIKSAVELDMMYVESEKKSIHEDFLRQFLTNSSVLLENTIDINASIYDIHLNLLGNKKFDEAASLFKKNAAQIMIPSRIYQNYFLYFRDVNNLKEARKWNRVSLKYSQNVGFNITQTESYLNYLSKRSRKLHRSDSIHHLTNSFNLLKKQSDYLSGEEFEVYLGQLMDIYNRLETGQKNIISNRMISRQEYCNSLNQRIKKTCLRDLKL